jgi:hypothetical protein
MFHSPSFFLYHIMPQDKIHKGKGKRRVRTMLFPASLNHRELLIQSLRPYKPLLFIDWWFVITSGAGF